MSNYQSEAKHGPAGLKVHEWLAVVLLIAAIGGVAGVTSFGQSGEKAIIAGGNEGIEIFVKGAVAYPGSYRLPSEMTMQDVLALAQVEAGADLRRFNLNAAVRRGRIINVPARHMITVHLKGAVSKPGAVSMPKGAHLEELLNMVEFKPEADRQWLRKKRKLKADEIIDVPYFKAG